MVEKLRKWSSTQGRVVWSGGCESCTRVVGRSSGWEVEKIVQYHMDGRVVERLRKLYMNSREVEWSGS